MSRILDLTERLFVILLSIPFVVAFAIVLPTHPQFILLAISELLAVVLVLVRKSGEIAATPYAFAIAILGTALPLLARPDPAGIALLPTYVTVVVMTVGLSFSVFAKLFLNRSFGIVAANRGVKHGGPYRIVRHPMYAGYMTAEVGFLLASFTWFNLVVYLAAWAIQILRVREEERWLMKDERYRNFAAVTRWRLVPGLY